jgi:hypothetical protein
MSEVKLTQHSSHAVHVAQRDVGRRSRVVQRLGTLLTLTRDGDRRKARRRRAFHLALNNLFVAEMRLVSIETTLRRRSL